MLLAETIKLIERMKHGVIDIIECGIEIGYREQVYYAQFGMFAIPPIDHKTLKRLHCMAFGIPRIDDDVYRCVLIPGQLLTNAYGKALTGYCCRRGQAVQKGS